MLTNSIKKNSVYTFDWDDNILHMPTKIKMDKKDNENWIPIEVEPAEFAIIRGDKDNYRIRNNDPVQAFDEFLDYGPRGDQSFIQDVIISVSKEEYGPSWKTFLNCIKQANLFGIVTSRSHEFFSIRKGVEYIIDRCLTLEEKRKMYINCCNFGLNDIMKDSFYAYELRNNIDKVDYSNFSKNSAVSKYLDICKYYGVGLPFSEDFKKEFNLSTESKMTIQEAKKMSINRLMVISDKLFTKIYTNGDIEVFNLGFSDDDKKTIDFIKTFFDEYAHHFRGSKLCVYDTSDRKIKGGIKTKYYEEYDKY